MKQRILLIVAMLLIAAPAVATVNINVVQDSVEPNKLTVSYNCTASEAVRAFALDFTLTNPGNPILTFSNIADFNRGESNKPGGGYGIFPGQFGYQIDPANPDWYTEYYYPVAPSNDVDSNGQGMGESKMIVELGTLYKDSNAPGTSGTLFTVRVDPNSGQTCSELAVTTNTIRGGVVLENGSSVTPVITVIPTTICLVNCPDPPATLTYPAADGNNGRYEVSWAAAANADGYELERSADGGGTWIPVPPGTFSGTTACDDVNNGAYRYRVRSTASGCDPSAWMTGTSDCTVTLCHPADSNLANWYSVGKPRCWCYARQCRGDHDGLRTGNAITGYQYVVSADLTQFMQAYLVKEPPKGPGLQGEPNLCCDFDHNRTGNAITGYQRVTAPDLTRFMASYLVKEPPKGSGVPVCPGTHIDPAWPKPCN